MATERTPKPAADAPLIVDKKMKRFWALVAKDGTLRAENVSGPFDRGSESHDEVVVYTSLAIATRAAADALLSANTKLEPVEVTVFRTEGIHG